MGDCVSVVYICFVLFVVVLGFCVFICFGFVFYFCYLVLFCFCSVLLRVHVCWLLCFFMVLVCLMFY